MERLIKQGKGWRLGWNFQASLFQGLVGGEDWALELTAAEFDDFCRLLIQLAETFQQMSYELMDEEKLRCEVESDLLWLEASGYPQAFSLRLLLQQGRRGEGAWYAPAVPDLIQAAQTIKVF
jgi:hypothetical protein